MVIVPKPYYICVKFLVRTQINLISYASVLTLLWALKPSTMFNIDISIVNKSYSLCTTVRNGLLFCPHPETSKHINMLRLLRDEEQTWDRCLVYLLFKQQSALAWRGAPCIVTVYD